MLAASIMGIAGRPAPMAKYAAPFDYVGAIARLEEMGVQFSSVGLEGYSRRLNGVREARRVERAQLQAGLLPLRDGPRARQARQNHAPAACLTRPAPAALGGGAFAISRLHWYCDDRGLCTPLKDFPPEGTPFFPRPGRGAA